MSYTHASRWPALSASRWPATLRSQVHGSGWTLTPASGESPQSIENGQGVLPPYLVVPSSAAGQRTREQLAESRLLINLLKHGSHTKNLRLFNDFASYLLQRAELATLSRGGWYCRGARKICDGTTDGHSSLASYLAHATLLDRVRN
jgi:hypothetical protein